MSLRRVAPGAPRGCRDPAATSTSLTAGLAAVPGATRRAGDDFGDSRDTVGTFVVLNSGPRFFAAVNESAGCAKFETADVTQLAGSIRSLLAQVPRCSKQAT